MRKVASCLLMSIVLILAMISCSHDGTTQPNSTPAAPQAVPTPASPSPPIQLAHARLEYALNTGLVQAISGNVPIIVTAPHGGTKHALSSGKELEERTRGQRISDFKTDELTLELKDYLEHHGDIRPYYIIANFHRKYVDANRRPDEDDAVPKNQAGSFYSQNIQCYNEYHKAIADTIEHLHRLGHQKILLLDIHGHGVGGAHNDAVYLGTLCVNQCPNARSDKNTIQLDSQNIKTNFIRTLTEEIGPAFIASGRHVATRKVVEVNEGNQNESEAHQLTGGWTVRKYYKAHNKVSAIQLEHGGGLRLEEWQRKAMAKALGESIRAISANGYGKLAN